MSTKKMTVQIPLESLMKDFKYKMDHDSFDDINHNGYTKSDILSMNLSLPKKYDKLDQLFPYIVARALEDAERDALASDLSKRSRDALIEALEKINPGTVEYIDMENRSISEKAYVESASYDKDTGMVSIEMVNPHHLINGMIGGVGYIAPDLDSQQDPSVEDIVSRIHNLHDYFDIYGESKPSDELDSRHSPDVSDQLFSDHLESSLEMLQESEIGESIKDAVDNERLDLDEAIALAVKHSGKDEATVKGLVLAFLKTQIDQVETEFKDWSKKLK